MRTLYPWQYGLWQQLAAAENLHHALLITGAEGTGKRHFAQGLAEYLLCQHPVVDQNAHSVEATPRACGQCRACLLLQGEAHPDLHTLEPAEPGKPITVDAVRGAIEWVTKSSQLGGRKLLLVAPAEAMNINAANSLLKTLEEPPANTHILLVSHSPTQLLPTIRSRTQQYQMPGARNGDETLAWLVSQAQKQEKELNNIDDEQLKTLLPGYLKLSEGAPLKALDLLTQSQASSAVLAALTTPDWQPKLAPLLKLPLTVVLFWLSAYIDEVVRLKLDVPTLWLESEQKGCFSGVLTTGSEERVLAFAQQLAQSHKFTQTQANPQLILENLLIQWQTCR